LKFLSNGKLHKPLIHLHQALDRKLPVKTPSRS